MATEEKRVIPVDIVDSIGSTNSFLKQNCTTLEPRFTLRAKIQTAGRGRFDRQWVAIPDQDLTFSTLVPVSPLLMEYLTNIPQIVALAVNEFVTSCGLRSLIKWPNDILVEGKKLAGILVEGVFQGGNQYLVIGVGLNLNSSERVGVTIGNCSLFSETGKKYDPDSVMMSILHGIYDRIEILECSGFSSFVKPLNDLLAYRNEMRTVTIAGVARIGEIYGVSESGALLFRPIGGEIEELISGEISFRQG